VRGLAAWLVLTSVAGASVLVGCGGAPPRVATLDEMERVRGTPAAQEGARLAPGAFAEAERERALAEQAHLAGDDTGASLHAQDAIAAYAHALAIARFARAGSELGDAKKSFDDATAQEQSVEASRASLERDAADLEERVRIARDRLLPAASAAATADREAARLVAARSLALQARLLCDAARVVAAPDAASDLSSADADVGKLDDRLAKNPHPVPIDDAARSRARCLDVLTRSRRALGDEAASADALLAELSAAGGWDPSRDERGVVVTLRGFFRGVDLTTDGDAKLQSLGRVAAAHPGFALQVVVHDAQAPGPKDDSDTKRADAATRALVAGGAAAPRIKTELAGARAPVVDPADARARARNERLDVVFVAAAATH
jgi:hypothetical protein